MGFSKVIPLGEFGQISISEEGGVGKVGLGISGSLGGGSVSGALKATANVEVDASVIQLVDAGLVALEAKYPQFSGAIGLLKAAIDAEAGKL